MLTDPLARGHEGSGAIFSDETWPLYRYVLWRRWREGRRGQALFVMLNPSTANEDIDDPTVRRCRGYAKTWGYDGLTVCNAYAYRSTDPRALRQAVTMGIDPVGPRNDHFIEIAARGAAIVVCAWGVHAGARGLDLAEKLRTWTGGRINALAWTRDGAPRHPLYLAGKLQPLPWIGRS